MADETRARVIAAASQLNYTTNSGARNLRRARAGSIGLWLPRGLQFMEYYMNFAFGVVEGTQDAELTVSLIPAGFPPDKANGLHVDGFVMADVDAHDELARAILAGPRPVVTSELVPPGMPQPAASVAADHAAATRTLFDRLREGGARSIAVLIPDVDQTWVRAVHRAADDWSSRRGVEVTFVPLPGIPSGVELERIVGDLLEGHPQVDAIVCVPEGLGVGVLSAVRARGLIVPDDLQLASYVDSPTLAIVQPTISALDLRPRDAGERAGSLLVSLIEADGELSRSPELEWLELEYRERESTRAPRTASSSRPAD